MEDEEKDFMKSFSSLKKYIYEKKIIDNIKVEIFFPEKEEYSPLYTAIAKDCIRHARHGSWSVGFQHLFHQMSPPKLRQKETFSELLKFAEEVYAKTKALRSANK